MLWDCFEATVDICFVHGLTGDRHGTWTARGRSEERVNSRRVKILRTSASLGSKDP